MSENQEELVSEETAQPADAGFFVPENSEEDPQPEQEAKSNNDAEERAREMGWVPESEWKGDKRPPKFLSAEEFVERGETVIPILRSQLDKEREQSRKKEEEYAQRFERLEKMNKASVEALRRQHGEEMERIKSQMFEAARDGNVELYSHLDQKQQDLLKTAPEEEPRGDSAQKIVDDWSAKNDWFNSDFEANQLATNYSDFIAKKYPGMTLEENLRRTEEHVKTSRPDLFGVAPKQEKRGANGHAPVDSGGLARPMKDTESSKLPSEAKKQAQADVSAGLYKSVEEWAKVYFSS